jgi:putative phosphoribosyl transferase
MQPPYPLWVNRYAAGLALAELFSKGHGINSAHTLLLALPRGGVPVAAAMASQLNLPLATWSVRKIVDPAQSEVAIWAIAAGGAIVWPVGGHGDPAWLASEPTGGNGSASAPIW